MTDQQEAVQEPEGKQGNGFAVAGAWTSIVPPLGLVLSIVGLARSKTVGGAGRTAATVGIALSAVFAGGYGFAVAKAGGSGGNDPACMAAEPALQSMRRTFNADAQAQQAAGTNGAMLATVVTDDADDIGNAKIEVDGLLSRSTHADVKSRLQDLDSALGHAGTDFGDAAADPFDDLATVQSRLEADTDAIDGLCGSGIKG
jgi:hypothetical protein